MSDRSPSEVVRDFARKSARTALGCIIAGVVVWPLFPVGVALGVTAGVAGLVAEKLEDYGL